MDPLGYSYAKNIYRLKNSYWSLAAYMKGLPQGYRIKPYDFFILKDNDNRNNYECILEHIVFL